MRRETELFTLSVSLGTCDALTIFSCVESWPNKMLFSDFKYRGLYPKVLVNRIFRLFFDPGSASWCYFLHPAFCKSCGCQGAMRWGCLVDTTGGTGMLDLKLHCLVQHISNGVRDCSFQIVQGSN